MHLQHQGCQLPTHRHTRQPRQGFTACAAYAEGKCNQQQQPWRLQQQLDLQQALQQPAQRVRHELAAAGPRGGQLVVAAAAVAAEDASAVLTSSKSVDSEALLTQLRRRQLAKQLLYDDTSTDELEDALNISSFSASSPGSSPTSLISNSNGTSSSSREGAGAGSITSSSLTSVDGGAGSSLRERLRQRVASRAGPLLMQPAAAPLAPEPHSSAASTADAAAAGADPGGRHSPAAGSNDSSIDSVLQALQQRRERGFTKPGTRPAATKAAAAVNSSSSSSSSSAVTRNGTVKATALSGAAMAPAATSKPGKHKKLSAAGRTTAAVVTPPSARAVARSLNQKRRSPEAFAVLQQAAEAALQQAAAAKGSSSSPSDADEACTVHDAQQQQPAPASGALPGRHHSTPSPRPDLHTDTQAGQALQRPAPQQQQVPQQKHQRKQQQQAQQQVQQQVPRGKPVDPALAAVLASTGVPDQVLRRLLHECGSWKGASSPKALQGRLMSFDQAAALLGGPQTAADILAKDASILLMAPDALRGKLMGLEQLVQPGPADAQQQLQQLADGSPPELLVVHSQQGAGVNQPQQQQEQVQEGQQGVSRDVLALVASHPGILRLSSDRLSARMDALQDCLGLSSRHEVLQVVRWQPRVLSMSNSNMKLKAIALASVLGVPPTAVQDIFAKQPLLLNLSAKALVDKTRALKAALGYTDLQLWQLLFTKPGVLLFASDKMSNKWHRLQQLAGTHPRWVSELQQLSPSSLVQLLTASDSRLLRLQFLVERSKQDKTPLYSVGVLMPEPRFAQRFPGYPAWASAHKHKATAQE